MDELRDAGKGSLFLLHVHTHILIHSSFPLAFYLLFAISPYLLFAIPMSFLSHSTYYLNKEYVCSKIVGRGDLDCTGFAMHACLIAVDVLSLAHTHTQVIPGQRQHKFLGDLPVNTALSSPLCKFPPVNIHLLLLLPRPLQLSLRSNSIAFEKENAAKECLFSLCSH